MLKLLSCRSFCMVYGVRELFWLKENLMRESLASDTDWPSKDTASEHFTYSVSSHVNFLPTEPYLLKICKRLQKSYLNTGFKDCWLLEALRWGEVVVLPPISFTTLHNISKFSLFYVRKEKTVPVVLHGLCFYAVFTVCVFFFKYFCYYFLFVCTFVCLFICLLVFNKLEKLKNRLTPGLSSCFGSTISCATGPHFGIKPTFHWLGSVSVGIKH